MYASVLLSFWLRSLMLVYVCRSLWSVLNSDHLTSSYLYNNTFLQPTDMVMTQLTYSVTVCWHPHIELCCCLHTSSHSPNGLQQQRTSLPHRSRQLVCTVRVCNFDIHKYVLYAPHTALYEQSIVKCLALMYICYNGWKKTLTLQVCFTCAKY